MRRLKHWGWGYEDQQQPHEEVVAASEGIIPMLGFGEAPERPVGLDRVELRKPRLDSPGGMFTDDRHQRTVHSLGKAYRDIVRGFYGEFDSPPDLVAFPEEEAGVEEVLSRAADWGAAVIPFGGGTSVCGGVEPRLADPERPVVSLDMTRMNRLIEVDEFSLAARIQAGARGPELEDQLKAHGLTLRHFPQSFEYATLGGWIVTRAGGHFATGETHVDDLTESVRAITPAGEWESRRLPGSGAGPSPDRMLLGSEGILGVVTEAWMKVRPRPDYKATATVEFPPGDEAFSAAARGAVRLIAQSRLMPSNLRLIDALEARTTMAGDGSATLLIIGFESAGQPVGERMDQALAIAEGEGGRVASRSSSTPGDRDRSDDGEAGADRWRSAFLMAPYMRDTFVACGVIAETFETAVTWDRFEGFHQSVIESTRTAVAEVTGAPAEGEGAPRVSCRLTHVYPDGAAPYFTVLAPARRGSEVAQWDEVKAAASQAIIDGGGTITHHHAVGRDHRPFYDQQRPDQFAAALRAAKSAVDPENMLNPGVLID
ncbi:MAG: FAD-binding oxidoreductase [Solirubrobacterales bacterium]|nr:FAD-binding oxidoreductase [Solirubrobacterales bacterium]MCB0859103.1 FAD-binding oxidoreductase [Solirubrobacterales bacterium]